MGIRSNVTRSGAPEDLDGGREARAESRKPEPGADELRPTWRAPVIARFPIQVTRDGPLRTS